MKTYIINLERSTTRRRDILEEVKRCGLQYELTTGVDGQMLSEAQIAELCDVEAIKAAPNWLTRGMLGAAISHSNVYRRIIENGDDMAFVLEDDMILSDDLPRLLDAAAANIGPNEVILFHYFSLTRPILSTQDTQELVADARLHFPYVDSLVGAGGYLITRKAAESLLKFVVPIRLAPGSWGTFCEEGVIDKVRCVYPRPDGFQRGQERYSQLFRKGKDHQADR